MDKSPASGKGLSAEHKVTRRTFLVWWMAGLMTATAAAVVAPLLVYIWPPVSGGKKLLMKVDLGQPLDGLQDDISLRFEAAPHDAFVLTTGGGDNSVGDPAFAGWIVRGAKTAGKTVVFAVNCPHLGCAVGFDKGRDIFLCPCHGSEFNLEGKVLKGPAVAPLAHLGWKPGPDGRSILVAGESLAALGF